MDRQAVINMDDVQAKLFELYEDGSVQPIELIGEGLSGARTLLVNLRGRSSRDVDDFAFAKIDEDKRSRSERKNHEEGRKVQAGKAHPYIPALIGSACIGPVEGWSLNLYRPAGNTILYGTSLGRYIESAEFNEGRAVRQLDLLLNNGLALWHDPRDLNANQPEPIFECFQRMINIGKPAGEERTRALEDRARRFGLPGKYHRYVQFLPGAASGTLPNPFAFALDPALWLDKAGKPRTLITPTGAVHGDFHGGNIVCKVDKNSRQPLDTETPWIIDLAQYSRRENVFLDLAYLEFDILLRTMKAETDEQWQEWLQMTEFLSRDTLPEGTPNGKTTGTPWQLIRPIRNYAKTLLPADAKGEVYEQGWWLAAAAAGVIAAYRENERELNRAKVEGQRKAALLYAARCLKQMIFSISELQAEFVNSADAPFNVQWRAGAAPLTAEMIAAYRDGLFSKIRDTLREQVVQLSGEVKPHIGPRDENPLGLDDQELAEVFGDLLPPEKPLTAREDAEPVKKVRERMLDLSRVVLLGEPGSGKSTTLQRLALDYADQQAKDERQPLPVFVELAKFNGRSTFREFALSYLGNLQPYADHLPLVWLLDALNEMPRTGPDGRKLLSEVLDFLMKLPADARFVISCRVRDYDDELKEIAEVYKIELRSLGPDQIYEMIYRRLPMQVASNLWSELQGSNDLLESWKMFDGYESEFWKYRNPPDAVAIRYFDLTEMTDLQRADFLKKWNDPLLRYSYSRDNEPLQYPELYHRHNKARDAVHQDPSKLMLMCRNPFILGKAVVPLAEMLDSKSLPKNRAQLFRAFVQLLLRREASLASLRSDPWLPNTAGEIETVLTELAVAIQINGREQRRQRIRDFWSPIDRSQLTEIPSKMGTAVVGGEDKVSLLVKAASANIIRYEETIGFSHQLLQEYFAIRPMQSALEEWEKQPQVNYCGDDHNAVSFFAPWWERGTWFETVRLLSEALQDPNRVARWLACHTPKIALEVIETFLSGAQPLTEDTRGALIRGAKHRTSERHPHGRAAAWRVLGRLGADERRGVVGYDWEESYWRRVEAGEFLMGYERQAERIEYDYWIGQYPATYGQYKVFLEAANGYQEQRWWAGLSPEALDQREGDKQRWKIGNHPAEEVSWYDAMAFCAWLNGEVEAGRVMLPIVLPPSYGLRLPMREEWMKASQGTDGRWNPWGDFDIGHANIDETWEPIGPYHVGMTTAVGMYEHGKSPYGAYDMSGNVREWCLETGANPTPYISKGALCCGGGWDDRPRDSGCLAGVYADISTRSSDIGFRLVIAPIFDAANHGYSRNYIV